MGGTTASDLRNFEIQAKKRGLAKRKSSSGTGSGYVKKLKTLLRFLRFLPFEPGKTLSVVLHFYPFNPRQVIYSGPDPFLTFSGAIFDLHKLH